MLPKIVAIPVTCSCNLSCNYCTFHNGNERPKKLNNISKELLSKCEEIVAITKYADVTGLGEFSSSPIEDEVLAMLRKHGAMFQLSTNGTTLSDRVVQSYIDSGLNLLNLSVQGISKVSCENVCGRDISEHTINVIKMLGARKEFRFTVTMVPNRFNCHEVKTVSNLARDCGAAEFQVKDMVLTNKWSMENVVEIDRSFNFSVKTEHYDPYLANGEVFCGSGCIPAFVAMIVSADGCVFPCCISGGHKSFGNLLRQHWEEIWFCEEWQNLRNLASDTRFNCSRCQYKVKNV